jgi:hemoglobin
MLTERQQRAAAEIARQTGIDATMINRVVHAFYGKMRQDEVLGPVFAARISDWEPHLARICEFWSSVALMTGIYHGRPMEKHLPLPVDARHFDRWLRLFGETASEVCPAAAAAHFIERAARIAQSLEIGIAVNQGVLLPSGQRFRRPDLLLGAE